MRNIRWAIFTSLVMVACVSPEQPASDPSDSLAPAPQGTTDESESGMVVKTQDPNAVEIKRRRCRPGAESADGRKAEATVEVGITRKLAPKGQADGGRTQPYVSHDCEPQPNDK